MPIGFFSVGALFFKFYLCYICTGIKVNVEISSWEMICTRSDIILLYVSQCVVVFTFYSTWFSSTTMYTYEHPFRRVQSNKTSEFNSISKKMEQSGWLWQLSFFLFCGWRVCKYYVFSIPSFLLVVSLWDSISSSTGCCLRTSWSRFL